MRTGRRAHQPRQQQRDKALVCAAALLAFACAARPAPPALTPTAAIAARGGPLESFTRRSELVVHYGFPGRWRWELSYRRPDRFRLVLDTTGEPQTLASDGITSRIWHGDALLTEEPSGGSCSATLARWLAVAALDSLNDPTFQWTRLAARDAPHGTTDALRARCADDHSEFRLYFDRDLRLVHLSGPVSIPTLGAGRLAAHFHDFRGIGGYTLPYAIDYTLDGERFAEERIQEIVPNDPALGAEAFRRPPAPR